MRTSRFDLLIFCIVAGLGVVAWRTKVRAETARAIARTEARACGVSIELQLGQASTAAEVLGALARQARGGFTNFQRVATDLLTGHPGLASLELQPGGVVSDVVPRAGHERAVGFNVLKDAGQRVAANEAIARRVLTVAGPVTLDHGEQGIVARVPVFQGTSDGRDAFWGFMAVSMRLQEALGRAQVDDLIRQGYNFVFFAVPSGQQKTVASHGLSSLQDTVQQSVRAQNLEFRLALKPRGGWINKTKVAIESLAVLLISGIVALSVNLLESQRAVEAELTEATPRLAREASDRSQAEAACRGAKERMATTNAELKLAQIALQRAEAEAAQFQARLDASDRERDETAQAHQEELEEAHVALQKAQETITQLQARLDATAQAGKVAASAAQERLLQKQAAMADLQNRMDTATGSTREIAEATAARAAEEKPSAIPIEHDKPRSTELSTSEIAATRSIKDSTSLPSLIAVDAGVAIVSPAEPSVTHKAVKAGKRKKAPRDDQLHLFGKETSAVPATNQSAAEPETPVLEARDPKIPAIEIATPAETPVSDRPNTASADTSRQERSKRSGPKSRPTSAPETAGAEVQPTPDKAPPESSRRQPPASPVDVAQLRIAVSQILPLLAERDPGAKDCLRDNRRTFRSAFTPEAYVEFEQLVKDGDFDAGLEQLKKAARKHGISL